MYKRGEALTLATLGLAALAALGFYVLSVVQPKGLTQQGTPLASSTELFSTTTE